MARVVIGDRSASKINIAVNQNGPKIGHVTPLEDAGLNLGLSRLRPTNR